MISFESLASDILIHIRMKNSSSRMDNLLNLGPGQYSRWESGKVQIKWDDFVIICKRFNIPLAKALKESFQYHQSPFHYDTIIKACTGNVSQASLGNSLGVTRYTINRWLNRKSSPSLSQMLQIIHHGTTKLLIFIEKLAPKKQFPSLLIYSKHTEHTLEILQKKPWISGLFCCLKLSEYKRLPKHSHQWLAQKTNLPVSEIKSTIEELEKLDILRLNKGHYESTLNEINPSVLKASARKLLLYWMEQNMASIGVNYPSPNRTSLSSYHIFSVDDKTGENIKNLYINFVNEMTVLINNGQENPEKTFSFTLSMVNFDDFKKL